MTTLKEVLTMRRPLHRHFQGDTLAGIWYESAAKTTESAGDECDPPFILAHTLGNLLPKAEKGAEFKRQELERQIQHAWDFLNNATDIPRTRALQKKALEQFVEAVNTRFDLKTPIILGEPLDAPPAPYEA